LKRKSVKLAVPDWARKGVEPSQVTTISGSKDVREKTNNVFSHVMSMVEGAANETSGAVGRALVHGPHVNTGV
jgi:hypothetical protein